jgi:4-amino-4-deoxy-L-arabinose transferase-like glycosyltransferase
MKIKIMEFIYRYRMLIIILVVALMVRLWNLGNVPPSLTPDEAALGYNAYSILKTGRDEYGKLLPIVFKSFGDYKPGLYIYTTVPFVAIFGLNEWTVRLPSALAGVISVLLIYLIVKEFRTQNLLQYEKWKIENLAALTAAISPWLIYFSRGAWEANLSLTLTLAGIYFFLRSFKSSKYILHFSLFFALTLIAYQGAKLSTLLVIMILGTVFWKECLRLLRNDQKTSILSFGIGLVIISPIIFSFFNGQTGRLDVFSIFSYPRPVSYTQQILNEGNERIGGISYVLYHSESFNFVRGIAGRWFNHFSGKFLFFEGDYQNPRHSAPNSGMMLLFDIFLLPLGIIYLMRSNKFGSHFKQFIFLWLILSPLPAILTRDQVQSVRALNMSVPLIILSSLGLYYLLSFFRRSIIPIPFYMLIFVSYLLSFVYFFDSYYIHLPVHNAKYWNFGYKQMAEEVIKIKDNYQKVIVQQSYDQPYIYFLFYGSKLDPQNYNPVKYQKEANLVSGGLDVGLVGKLNNIEFMELSWPPPVSSGKTLIAGNYVAIPDNFSQNNFNLIKEIKYPDGYSTAFRLIEKK